jgi:TolB-like protein/DNA-binding winged helix-turn-helix (wHTH) protein
MSSSFQGSRRFADYEVDLDAGELRRDGVRVPLQEKPLQLLAVLLDRAGEVVARDELRRHLWPDVHVDFDGSLNAAVKKLRGALGDSARQPRFVATVPKRGYRFVGPAAEDAEADASEAAAPQTMPPPSRRWLLPAAVALASAVAVAVAAGWLRPAEPPARPRGKAALVVLPFENLSGDPARDYVSDGMTEEMIAVLSRLRPQELAVIARITSMTYRGTDKPVAEIGRELGVDYVLDGSVRGDAEQARITVQLIEVEGQTHLWAESYDTGLGAAGTGGLLAVQGEIARRIAGSLALHLLDDPVAASRQATVVKEAYDRYLRGRYQWNRFTAEGHRIAIRDFQRAIELDPGYAEAYAGLADAYNLYAFEGDGSPVEWFRRAREAAEKALNLDPELATAHNSLAFAVLYGDYDAVTADPIFRRALDLHPNYAMGYHWHAGALAALGRHDEAVRAVRRAVELDPLSLSVRSDLGWYYLFADRWAEAAEACQATLEMSPGYGWALGCLIEASERLGEHRAAVDLAVDRLRAAGLYPGSDPDSEAPGFDAMPPGEAMDAILAIHLDHELARADGGRDPFLRAVLHGRQGDLDRALDGLEEAYERHDPWLVFSRVDPRLDPLHGHPRFEALVSRMRIGDG